MKLKQLSRLLFLLLVSAFAYQANAQSTDDKVNILKGSIGLTGTASLNVSNSPGSSNFTTVSISPAGSFFLADNVALVAGVSFTATSFTQSSNFGPGTFKSTETRTLIGPVVGLAVYKPLIGRFGVRGSFLLGARFGTDKDESIPPSGPSSTSESDLLDLSASIVPSLYYRVSDRWLIEASFGALAYTWNESSFSVPGGSTITRENSTFEFSIRSGLGLGFTYLLNSK